MGSPRLWRDLTRRRAWRNRFVTLLVVFSTAAAFAQSARQEQSASLLPRQPTLFQLASGKALSLLLDPAEGKHAEILIETSAPGTEFVVLSPDGQQLQTASAEYSEWLAISFPCAGRGAYRLLALATPSQDSEHSIVFRAVVLHFSAAGVPTRLKAETLFARAQMLSRSSKATGLRKAIDAYKEAGTTWAAAGVHEGQVLALVGEAQAWLGLSEHDKAIATLYRAAALGAPTRYWRAWLANLQAQVSLDRWEIRPARKSAEEALQASRALKDDWLAADALADRGESEYLTHDPAAPVDIAQALRLARQVGAVSTMARALRCSAWMEKDEGHLTRAFSLLDQARNYFHSDGDIRPELQAMATLAQIENSSGEIYSTLLRHSKLASLMRDTGYTAHYAILLDDIGRDYEGLNRVPDAIVYFQQALAAYKSIHHASGEAAALLYLCSAELEEKRLNESLRDCQIATAIVEQFHDPWRLGDASWQLGKVQRVIGQTALAIASFRRAAELSRSVQNTTIEALALMDWGDTLEVLGSRGQARELYDKALPLSEAAETKPLQLEVRYRI
ncbi:MAG TPA: hypothetical protein VMI06_04765, partial [Terriglobia bacterium]|nr:hypothetical protein [Terriglobia bacterium]